MEILGKASLFDYALVLAIYGGLFVVMLQAQRCLPNRFVSTFRLLGLMWFIGTFVGNYVCYLLGIMSFMPWLNNFLHTFVWIAGCLGYMYAFARHRPMWEQFVLYVIFSFVVKVAENKILGTWELDHFLHVFRGNLAYLLGWSLADGLYPALSISGLRLLKQES